MSEMLHLIWYWQESRKLVSKSIRLLKLISRPRVIYLYSLQSNITDEAVPDHWKGKEKATELDSDIVFNQKTALLDSNFDLDSEFERIRQASLQELATCAEESSLPRPSLNEMSQPSSSRNLAVYDFRSDHDLLMLDSDSDEGYTYP